MGSGRRSSPLHDFQSAYCRTLTRTNEITDYFQPFLSLRNGSNTSKTKHVKFTKGYYHSKFKYLAKTACEIMSTLRFLPQQMCQLSQVKWLKRLIATYSTVKSVYLCSHIHKQQW